MGQATTTKTESGCCHRSHLLRYPCCPTVSPTSSLGNVQHLKKYKTQYLLLTIYSPLGVSAQILLHHDVLSMVSTCTTSATSVCLLTTSHILNLCSPLLRFPSTASIHAFFLTLCFSLHTTCPNHPIESTKVDLQLPRPIELE